eukprot:566341-Rhodomonas_salina.1
MARGLGRTDARCLSGGGGCGFRSCCGFHSAAVAVCLARRRRRPGADECAGSGAGGARHAA